MIRLTLIALALASVSAFAEPPQLNPVVKPATPNFAPVPHQCIQSPGTASLFGNNQILGCTPVEDFVRPQHTPVKSDDAPKESPSTSEE